MYSEAQIKQLKCEIEWLQKRLESPMSEKQRATYLNQIKHKELVVMFEENEDIK